MLLYEQRSAGSSLAAPVLDKKLDILILLFSMSFLLSDKKSQKYTANLLLYIFQLCPEILHS